jgi:hypothetical protein
MQQFAQISASVEALHEKHVALVIVIGGLYEGLMQGTFF